MNRTSAVTADAYWIRRWTLRMAACTLLALAALAAAAQTSILPAPCVGKSGEELDACVRDITPPQQSQRLEPAEAEPNPAQLVNCLKVHAADQAFCIHRNEVLLECRNGIKHPDLAQCFGQYIARAAKPTATNCAREKPASRARCDARNSASAACISDPLRYFNCIGSAGSVRAAAPQR